MYFINFDGKDEKHKTAFELFYQSIVATDKNADRDNEDDFIALLQQLKRISTVSSVTLGGGIKLRDLNPEGGSLALESSQYKLLVACMERPIWRPHVLEEKRTALNWLKEIKDTPVKPMNEKEAPKVLALDANKKS